jgi:hypothetical protein
MPDILIYGDSLTLGGDAKCVGLAEAYREVATALGCPFFDAGAVTSSSRVDGVHLDLDQHLALGQAIAIVVGGLLPSSTSRL